MVEIGTGKKGVQRDWKEMWKERLLKGQDGEGGGLMERDPG